MTDCNHDNLKLGKRIRQRLEHETGLPKQLALKANCLDCGDTVTVDYNIAFIDGDRP